MKSTDKNCNTDDVGANNHSPLQDIHPLKAWLDFWNITTEELAKATKRIAPPGLHQSFIRHICRDKGMASKKSALKLSKTTTIPASTIMFPEDFPGFNPEEYKPRWLPLHAVGADGIRPRRQGLPARLCRSGGSPMH